MEKQKNKIKIKGAVQSAKLILTKKNIVSDNSKNNTPLLLQNEYDSKNKKEFNKSKITVVKIDNFASVIKKSGSEKLKIKSISKSFNGRPVLNNLSFEVKQGEILLLAGANGSGKSTVYNCIIGKIKPDTGTILLDNKNISYQPVHERCKMGISLVEQSFGLFSGMTVYQNLYAILEMHYNDKIKIHNKIMYLLNLFKLEYAKDILCSQLSGGMYKKLVVLQRISNPDLKFLLLDEPCSALDPKSIQDLKKFIVELKKLNIGIILTDHQISSVLDISDRVIIIHDGTIISAGTSKQVVRDEAAIKYYLGSNFKF
jgi:lipopolysaccharide export system ATP-binding protein